MQPMESGEEGQILPAVVLADTLYCGPCKVLPECTTLVSYRLACGHILTNKPCSLAFAWASGEIDAPQCDAVVECASPLYVPLPTPVLYSHSYMYHFPLMCTSTLFCTSIVTYTHTYPVIHRCNHTVSVPCYAKQDLLTWQPWGEQGGKPDGEFISYLDDSNESCTREVVEQSDPRVFGDNGVCRINPLPPTVPRECLYCDGNGVEFKRDCGHSRVQRCVDVYFGNCGNCAETIDVPCLQPSCGAIRKRTCHEYEQQIREGHPPTCTNMVDKVCGDTTLSFTLTRILII